jgi:glyoxylase-like metal-dependent hydrolase (beta-lactamase superfamily II)
MKVKKHIVSPLQTNCYVAWDEQSRGAVVIDPGGAAKKIARTIKDKGLALQAIVHTHDHWDHIAGSNGLQRLTGAPVHRHPRDGKGGFFRRARKADGVKVHDLLDNQELKIGGLCFYVLHTPGHSRGSICLYSENHRFKTGESNVLFSGDLLFQGSVGRTDLSGGSLEALLNSLIGRLASIPDDTVVYPGHGPATVLGEERRTNPFFRMGRDLKR